MTKAESPQPRVVVGVWIEQFEGVRSVYWRSSEKEYSPSVFTPRKPEDLREVQGLVRQLHSEANAGSETAQTEAQRSEIYKDLSRIAVQRYFPPNSS